MSNTEYIVRAIKPNDDFELIEHLFFQTHINESKQEWMTKHKISYRRENWEQLLFLDSNDAKPAILKGLSLSGFVAEKNGVISAFATVGISPQSHNGYMDYGFIHDCDFMLEGLIECCGIIVKEAGGNKLYQTTSMPLGQIRNNQITILESHGFRCNQFYHVFVDNRNMDSWKSPEDLDLNSIQVPSQIEINEIAVILDQDKEFFLAEEFRGNFAQSTPDHVFLCLYDKEKEIKGVSYYKVWQKDESLFAMAFGIHFRPKYEVNREEVRQLIQATLVSMQQIGVSAAWSRISSQNFNTILVLSAEGFELFPEHSVMMVKSV
jgi:hypothetical protein